MRVGGVSEQENVAVWSVSGRDVDSVRSEPGGLFAYRLLNWSSRVHRDPVRNPDYRKFR